MLSRRDSVPKVPRMSRPPISRKPCAFPALRVLVAFGLAALAVALVGTEAFAYWVPDIRLTEAGGNSLTSHNNARSMVADPEGRLHVVWRDERAGNFEIYYKMSDGSSWTPDERLTFESGLSAGACVAVDPAGMLHVVWHDYRGDDAEIYYKRHDGTGWGPDVRLTDSEDDSVNPSLAAGDDGRLHVVWHDYRDGQSEIYYKCYDGAAWGPDERLTDDAASSEYPSVALDGEGRIHVVWTDRRDGHDEIYHKQFSDSAWGPDECLTPDPGHSEGASLCADRAGRLYLTWSDNRDGNYEIYYMLHDGATWQPEVRLSVGAGHSEIPAVSVDDGGHIHVAWQDDRHGRDEIYYRKFDGEAWGAEKRLTDVSAASTKPSIAVDRDGNVHVIWADKRDGNYEIYWKQWLNVILPKPEIASIQPAAGQSGEALTGVSLSGTGFVFPLSLWMTRGSEPMLVPENIRVVADTLVTFDIDLAGAAAGPWDVVLENPDGKRDTLAGGFEVTPDLVWGDARRLTYDPAASYTDGSRCIASDPAGNLHVVWCDTRKGVREVYCKRRQGSGWSPDERLTVTANGCWAPDVAAGAGGATHVVWYTYTGGGSEVCYRCYDGAGWMEAVPLSDASGFSLYPAVAADATGAVHVVWSDDCAGGFEIYHKTHDGLEWSESVRVTHAGGSATRPVLVAGPGGMLHLAWQDRRDGRYEIYYKAYDGVAWGEDERVTDIWASSEDPSIAVAADGTVHLVWADQRAGYFQVFYRARSDSGWQAEEQISHGAGHALSPSVGVDGGGRIHVVWEDHRDGAEGPEIYSARNDGRGWLAETRVTASPGSAAKPSIAVDGTDTVHLVWCDDCDGNLEIYHRTWSPVPAAAPEVTGLYPESAAETHAVDAVVTGTGFAGTPRVWLADAGGDTINAASIRQSGSTSIACTFDLTWRSPGLWDLHVRNADQQRAMLPAALRVYATLWTDPQPVVTDPPNAATGWNNGRCVLRDDAGGVHVVWHDNREGNYEIYHRRWDGLRLAWGEETRLTGAAGVSKTPSMVAGSGGTLHLCWGDNTSGTLEVYYKRYDGAAWSEAMPVSLIDGRQSKDPAMVLDGSGAPVIFYEDNRHGPWQIYCARQEGSAWIEVRLTDVDAPTYHPAAASDSAGHIHLVWEDERNGGIEVRYSWWDGLAWSESEVISSAAYSVWPCCACRRDGALMVVYCREFEEVRSLLKDGDVWRDLGTVDSCGEKPNLCADGLGNFHLAWEGSGCVYYQMYREGWTSKVRVNPGTTGAQPFVGADASGRAAVVWMDVYKKHSEIYMRRWEGDGEVAGTDMPTGPSARPAITRIVPNPVRDMAEVRFSLPPVEQVDLKIFDVRGRLVWKTHLERPEPGLHAVTWDSRDGGGKPVSPGLYFVSLRAGQRKVNAKVVVLR